VQRRAERTRRHRVLDEGEASSGRFAVDHEARPDRAEGYRLSVRRSDDPVERMDAVLRRYYGWYRETESMSENVQRDRGAVAPLNEVLTQTADAGLGHLADVLAAGFKGRGRVAARRRALIGLALDFWTWRRLDREGLDDAAAAAVMAQAVARAPSGH
jgi:hypothetical protein